MDETTKLILKNAAASVLRAALYALGTWLVSKGALSAKARTLPCRRMRARSRSASSPSSAALGWSIWQKKHANDKVDAALAVPAGTPREKFERAQDNAQ
jgi:hypothetical protein